MRFRRVEFVIIGVTLAFICFMGGFFTGRNLSAVNVVSVGAGSSAHGTHVQVEVEFGDTNETPEQSTESTDSRGPAQGAIPGQTPQADTQLQSQNEPAGAPRSGDGKININTASQTELTDLPGVGNTIASRIVDYRQQNGNFRSIEDIKNVSGIGEKRFEAIQELITVG